MELREEIERVLEEIPDGFLRWSFKDGVIVDPQTIIRELVGIIEKVAPALEAYIKEDEDTRRCLALIDDDINEYDLTRFNNATEALALLAPVLKKEG
jgi:phosphate uptake regulator